MSQVRVANRNARTPFFVEFRILNLNVHVLQPVRRMYRAQSTEYNITEKTSAAVRTLLFMYMHAGVCMHRSAFCPVELAL